MEGFQQLREVDIESLRDLANARNLGMTTIAANASLPAETSSMTPMVRQRSSVERVILLAFPADNGLIDRRRFQRAAAESDTRHDCDKASTTALSISSFFHFDKLDA